MRSLRLIVATAALAFMAVGPGHAADNWIGSQRGGDAVKFRSFDDGSGFQIPAHVNTTPAGVPLFTNGSPGYVVLPSGTVLAISATSLPLPTGAATEAGLGTDGASPPTIAGTGMRGWLRSIYERLAGTLTIGGTVSVSNLPATQAVSGSVTANLGTLNGAATSALQAPGNTSLASIDGKVPAKGQAAMAASTPVAIASDQSPIPVAQGATSAFSVQRTAAIGTTGTLVSAADTANRRTIRNTGSIALEIVPTLGATYGTGHPLPVGESFTFDNNGRMAGAIYLAGASAGGTASVISY